MHLIMLDYALHNFGKFWSNSMNHINNMVGTQQYDVIKSCSICCTENPEQGERLYIIDMTSNT